MDYNIHHSFRFDDKSYLALIKDKAKAIAANIGMEPETLGKVHIIATEMVTNLVKFASNRKEILISATTKGNRVGIELIAIDNGPGIKDMAQAMEDGYSTAGTKGEGIGAIRRLSDQFDIYSTVPGGTIAISRIFKKIPVTNHKIKLNFDFCGIIVPLAGQSASGDQWMWLAKEKECNVFCADGLGHGEHAEEASKQAVEIFKDVCIQKDPKDTLEVIHESIRKTRGAVGLALKLSQEKKNIIYCGVGNISAKILGLGLDAPKTLTSFNGILGMNARRMTDNILPWDNNKTIIIHSDGLNSRWDINNYKNILPKDPSILAAALYRDHARDKDDVCVIVGRNKK